MLPDVAAVASPSPQAALAPTPDMPDHRPAPRPAKPKPAAKPERAAGSANQNRKKGTTTGGDASTSATARTAIVGHNGDGGKAAASYGSTILRKIAKTRKARAPAQGRTVVGFVIAANGALQPVRLVASSGNAGLDKVALDHIRRSAPFPTPPSEAQRHFAFEFVGKR